MIRDFIPDPFLNPGPRLGIGYRRVPLLGGGAALQPGPPPVRQEGMGGWDKPESRLEAVTGVGGAGNERTGLLRPLGGWTLCLYPNPNGGYCTPCGTASEWVGGFLKILFPNSFPSFYHYSLEMWPVVSHCVECVRDV
jgi:hypothetical protein